VVGVSGAYGGTAERFSGALDWLFGEEEAEGAAEEVSEYLGLGGRSDGTPQAQSPRRLPKSGPETPVLPQKLPQTP